MGSNDREVGKIEARPRVWYPGLAIPPIMGYPDEPEDGLLSLARTLARLSGDQAREMARAVAEMAANDDAGTV